MRLLLVWDYWVAGSRDVFGDLNTSWYDRTIGFLLSKRFIRRSLRHTSWSIFAVKKKLYFAPTAILWLELFFALLLQRWVWLLQSIQLSFISIQQLLILELQIIRLDNRISLAINWILVPSTPVWLVEAYVLRWGTFGKWVRFTLWSGVLFLLKFLNLLF